MAGTHQSTGAPSAVYRPNRNGYAVVVGRIVDLLAEAGPGTTSPRVVRLSRAAEGMLKDADAQQLSEAGVGIASSGSAVEWRTFVDEHFRRKYDLTVTFDAPRMTID